MKNFEVTIQQTISYRLCVRAGNTSKAEDLAVHEFTEGDDPGKEVFSEWEVILVEEAAP